VVGRRKKEAEEQEGEVFEFPDMTFVGPNLDIEAPAFDVPYDRYDDENSLGLLAVNGIEASDGAVLQALSDQTGVLLAAAAHAAGVLSVGAAVPRLRELCSGPDDQAAVEAAFALVRLGEDDARSILHEALLRPVDAYLSAVLAANYLARLGDPAGFPVVRAGLASEFLATRMLACRSLLLFVPYAGQAEPSGATIDVAALYDQALHDPEPGIRGEALVQLRWAPPELAQPLLERYLASSHDDLLRGYATEALEHPAGG
jgi:hypothetical protein